MFNLRPITLPACALTSAVLLGCASSGDMTEVRKAINRLHERTVSAEQRAQTTDETLQAIRARQAGLEQRVSAVAQGVHALRQSGAADDRAREATRNLEAYIRDLEREVRAMRLMTDRLEIVDLPGTSLSGVRVRPAE